MNRDKKARLLKNIGTALSFASEILLLKTLYDYERRIGSLENTIKNTGGIPENPMDVTGGPGQGNLKKLTHILVDSAEPVKENTELVEDLLNGMLEKIRHEHLFNVQTIRFMDMRHDRHVMTAACVPKDDGSIDIDLMVTAHGGKEPTFINGAHNVWNKTQTKSVAGSIAGRACEATMKERVYNNEAIWSHDSQDKYIPDILDILRKNLASDEKDTKEYSLVNYDGELPVKLSVEPKTVDGPNGQARRYLEVSALYSEDGKTSVAWYQPIRYDSLSGPTIVNQIANDLYAVRLNSMRYASDQKGDSHD